MQTAIFYGASDDLVEVEGIKGGDEFTVDNKDGATFVLGGRIRIRLEYGRGGVWTATIGQVNADVPLPSAPDWFIRVSRHPQVDYSVRVEVECPDDATLVREYTDG